MTRPPVELLDLCVEALLPQAGLHLSLVGSLVLCSPLRLQRVHLAGDLQGNLNTVLVYAKLLGHTVSSQNLLRPESWDTQATCQTA